MIRNLFLMILMISIQGCHPEKTTMNDNENNQHKVGVDAGKKVLRHLVLFKFNESASQQQIDQVLTAFADLPQKIKEIHGFEWGVNISPENINKGFTHSFLLSFKSEADRDAYLPHPDHKNFGNIVKPMLEDVLVIDYWTN